MERHAGALAVDDEARRDALHAARRCAGADATEGDVRHLVAVETVEGAPPFLRLDQLHVEVAPVLDRVLDGFAGDLVEHHPLHRDARLEHLEEVPRDGLALAVLVGREVELAGVLERGLQLRDDLLLVVGHDVDRREVVVDVDAEPADLGLGHALGRELRAPGRSRMCPTLAMTV